jgi:pimeloyl-ACP methyl ester carboxylesterase
VNRRAAALCGAAAVVAGLLSALPHPAAAAPVAPRPAWKKCATADYPTLQCASVSVPLDHTHPGGRRITLALSRVPHTAPRSSYEGPLLVNPGGPGGSGLKLAGFVAAALGRRVAGRYDVIGFDPRGVGRSSPALDCRPGYFEPVRPPSVPDTPAVELAGRARARAFAQACAHKYADLLPYLDTADAARDLDVVRQALGAPRISYFGYSYGTYLGAMYGRLFPHRVHRMVLDSMVDPTGVWYADNLRQDLAFNARHRAFLAWVAHHDAVYRLGSGPAHVAAAWYGMRRELARHPAGGTVGAAELEDTFLPGGYFDGYWPVLATAFAAYVRAHDPKPLVAAYRRLGAVDAAGDNGYSVYAAVECRDAAWPRAWRTWHADNARVQRTAPFSTWNNAWYNAPCAFWPRPRTAPPGPLDVTTRALPAALLFQATQDAATPYRGGLALHRALGGSRLVVEKGGGNHGITLSGNACLDRYLTAYLTSGALPHGAGAGPVDATCARRPDPKPQTTKSADAPGEALHRMIGFRP